MWAVAHAERLDLATVIFDRRIWTGRRSLQGWRDYRHPSGETDNPVLHARGPRPRRRRRGRVTHGRTYARTGNDRGHGAGERAGAARVSRGATTPPGRGGRPRGRRRPRRGRRGRRRPAGSRHGARARLVRCRRPRSAGSPRPRRRLLGARRVRDGLAHPRRGHTADDGRRAGARPAAPQRSGCGPTVDRPPASTPAQAVVVTASLLGDPGTPRLTCSPARARRRARDEGARAA